MPGHNEASFRDLCNVYKDKGVWFEKKPDVRLCWRCKAPAFESKTDKSDTREVKASRVDFLIGVKDRVAWVECKSGEDSFIWSDEKGMGIRAGQRVFMNDKEKAGVQCWIFLTLGEENVLRENGKESFLIRWTTWLKMEEYLKEQDMKSMPWKKNNRKTSILNVHDCFGREKLVWISGSWTIPDGHPFKEEFPKLSETKKEDDDAESTELVIG